MSQEEDCHDTESLNLTSKSVTPIQRPDLNRLSVGLETLKGFTLGAIVGTVILGVIEGFHLVRGKKPISRITGEFLTNKEHGAVLAESIGIIAASGGVGGFVEALSKNHAISQFKPYVEMLETKRNAQLEDKPNSR